MKTHFKTPYVRPADIQEVLDAMDGLRTAIVRGRHEDFTIGHAQHVIAKCQTFAHLEYERLVARRKVNGGRSVREYLPS